MLVFYSAQLLSKMPSKNWKAATHCVVCILKLRESMCRIYRSQLQFSLTTLDRIVSSHNRQLFSAKKLWQTQTTDKVSKQHLAITVKSHIFTSGVGGDQNWAKRKVHDGLTFASWPETWLQMNAHIAPELLSREYFFVNALCSQLILLPPIGQKNQLMRFWCRTRVEIGKATLWFEQLACSLELSIGDRMQQFQVPEGRLASQLWRHNLWKGLLWSYWKESNYLVQIVILHTTCYWKQ